MSGNVLLKRELGRMYQEFQSVVGQLLDERVAFGEDISSETEHLIEQMAAPLQAFIAAYGVDFDELVQELKKGMN